MKIKHIVLATSMVVSFSAFAQKDELKTLKKLYAKDKPSTSDIQEYKNNISKLEGLAKEESDVVYTNFYKSMTPLLELSSLGANATPAQMNQILSFKSISDLVTGLNSTLDFEKKSGKKVYTDDINETIKSYKPVFLNYAISLGNAEKYKEASKVLFAIYQMDKKDQDKLYFAANFAFSAQDYDEALNYYNQLKDINYSGEGVVYWAENKASKKEETFNTKAERDIYIKSGTHISPRDEKLESKRGEIYKNIALILIEKNKVNEAKEALTEARKMNPNDESLILTEADLYLKLNDFETYTKLIKDVLQQNPNNADLVYNLGVISANANKLDEAEKYYIKALEINPNYFNANFNLAELKLRADDKFVKEMNKLGTSEKENKRYEILKAEREKNFKYVLPYLEKAVELQPDNEMAKSTLLSVYNFLEMTDKAKALKAKK
jgi:tetratricopeptide (TPR) repeat protein